jgi:hypothetical protein
MTNSDLLQANIHFFEPVLPFSILYRKRQKDARNCHPSNNLKLEPSVSEITLTRAMLSRMSLSMGFLLSLGECFGNHLEITVVMALRITH